MSDNYQAFRQMSGLPHPAEDYAVLSKGIDDRTVKFQLPRGRHFRRYHFVEALKTRIEVKEIETIGTHQNAFVWFATLRTIEAQKKIIDGGRILINNVETMPLSMNINEVNIRVHWLPYNVHNHLLGLALSSYGEVLRIDYERDTDKDFSHIRTNVRSVVMRFESEHDFKNLPHIMNINGDTKILITCKGRRPLCLRCHMEGHVRSKCNAPYCRYCACHDHSTEDCTLRNSYAAALKQRQEQEEPEQIQDTIMDPADEEEENEENEEKETDAEKETEAEKDKEEKKKEEDEEDKRLFIDTDADDEEEETEEKKEEKTKEKKKTEPRKRDIITTEEETEEDMDFAHTSTHQHNIHTDTDDSLFQTPDGFTKVQRRSQKRKVTSTTTPTPPTDSPITPYQYKRRGRSQQKTYSKDDKV